MSSLRARCARHRERSGGGHEGERDRPCSPGAACCQRDRSCPGQHGRGACGQRRVQRAGGTHRAQPLHGEKVLEPPYLGLCAGVAGVSKLCWRWGRHARWGERPEASSPMPVHPPLVAPAPGGRPAFAVERRAASQLCQQSSSLQPLWARSQRGQREPGPGGSPGCLLELSPGQGSQG